MIDDFASATEWTRALREGQIGSRELLERLLTRIESLDPKIHAVVTLDLDLDRARARADAADAARARGENQGLLHGLPMTVKDTLETAGMRTTAGAEALRDHVPTESAVVVQRLEAAGAIVFGKTNTPTFGGDIQTYNPIFPTTNNPWDLTRTPGGSSGGSAAALAAGFTPLEVGSDIGGSIRTPAHFSGVYGLKPSYGVVPMRGHVPGPPGQLSEADIVVLGPMARSAEDLALGIRTLSGATTPNDAAWRLELPEASPKALRDFRVAAWLDQPTCRTGSAVRESLEGAVRALRSAGVEVDEAARPDIDFDEVVALFRQLLWAVLATGLPKASLKRFAEMARDLPATDTTLLGAFARAASMSHREWLSLNERREKLRARFAAFFENYDVLLCPPAVSEAFAHQQEGTLLDRRIEIDGVERPYMDLISWAGVGGVLYLPSVVAPIEPTPSGLPVGVQILAPYLQDLRAVEFARHLGTVIGGFQKPPL